MIIIRICFPDAAAAPPSRGLRLRLVPLAKGDISGALLLWHCTITVYSVPVHTQTLDLRLRLAFPLSDSDCDTLTVTAVAEPCGCATPAHSIIELSMLSFLERENLGTNFNSIVPPPEYKLSIIIHAIHALAAHSGDPEVCSCVRQMPPDEFALNRWL